MLSIRLVYIFSYNLFQFCGHTWILTNTVVRFLTFGPDALADTFHSIGLVMSLCQLLAVLELFHIADGLEKARLLPRFIQVLEKNLLLLFLILAEEVQSKPLACLLLFFWNILDLLRYPHEVMCVMDLPSPSMLWARYTLWIPIYVLTVITEGLTVFHTTRYMELEAFRMRNATAPGPSPRPLPLVVFLPLLALGGTLTVWQSLIERTQQIERWAKKTKKK